MVNMRNEILTDCVKEFPCICDRKDKGYKDQTVLEVYNRVIWHTFITCNFQIIKKNTCKF